MEKELKNMAFVNIIDTKNKQLDKYAILSDGNIYFNVKIKNLDTLKLLEKSMVFNVSSAMLEYNINIIIQTSKSGGNINGISHTDAMNIVFRDLSINVTGNTIYQLNSTEKMPRTKAVKNINSGQFDIVFENDVVVHCPPMSERNELIESVYSQIENGDYILYYINEFRHCHKIPILVFVGPGGAGKTSAGVNPFISYKPAGKVCKSFFAGDNSTGELGNTSLIVEEESDMKKSPNLTLNMLKDSTTTNYHNIRRLYADSISARGFLTFLFSCNDNHRSHILSLLNAKGEDAVSIKRRTSTFYFDSRLANYLNQPMDSNIPDGKSRGRVFSDYLNIDTHGDGSSPFDRHLNYLESIGFFNNNKFKKLEYNLLTVHSPKINICESLSNDMGVLLEELYDYFIVGKTDRRILKYDKEEIIKYSDNGNIFTNWKYNSLEQAIITITKGKPSKKTLLYNLNVVAKDAFSVVRSNSNYVIILKSSEILIDAYNKQNGNDEIDVQSTIFKTEETF
jgi:hypothetical protein